MNFSVFLAIWLISNSGSASASIINQRRHVMISSGFPFGGLGLPYGLGSNGNYYPAAGWGQAYPYDEEHYIAGKKRSA